MLLQKNRLSFDGRIVLTQDHRYVLDGKHTAPLSVTKLIEQQVQEPFDGAAVVRKNLSSWRANASSKYHALVSDLSDVDATTAILAQWDAAAEAGTSMHHQLELRCNNQPCTEPTRHAVELAQFATLRAQEAARGELPVVLVEFFRTELSLIGLGVDGLPLLGGQLDLLTRDEV